MIIHTQIAVGTEKKEIIKIIANLLEFVGAEFCEEDELSILQADIVLL